MLRVLMVLEDYGELMFLQTVLKKMGFDVDAIQNPRALSDNLLSLNPEVLVMTADGKRVNGIELSRTIRKVRGTPNVILLRALNASAEEVAKANADAWLVTPVAAIDLINMIAELCGLNKSTLQEKFQKLQLKELEDQSTRTLEPTEGGGASFDVSQANGAEKPKSSNVAIEPTTMSNEDRSARYSKFLGEKPSSQHGFSIKEVQNKVRELRRAENPEDLEELERQRKAFVEHLFKKK